MDAVREVQERFDEAERGADLDTLRELIAEDFLSIGPRGFVLDKSQWIARHQEFTYQSLDPSELDVRRYGEVQRAVEAVVARFGGLDIVVNNAGVGIFADVASMTPEQFAEVIETNLTGVFNVCHAALPHLRGRGGAFIINISSLAGKNAFANGAAYCASKSGLNAFSEALMQEVRYDDVRVSYVMPGSVATGFSSGDAAKGADWKIAPEEVAEVVVNLLRHDSRSLPSRVELRPSKPKK